MKRILFVLLCILLIGGFAAKALKDKLNHDLSQPVSVPTQTPSPIPTTVTSLSGGAQSLFVPYWTLKNEPIDTSGFDTLIYFGITPAEIGINTSEPGASNIERFRSSLADSTKTKLLTLRMLNNQNNLSILKDANKQQKLITQTLQIAKQNGFNGIVLDLEITAIPFDSLVQQINSFTQKLYSQAKEENLTLSLALYGDTFYRLRPFDTKTLTRNADTIMIMAYDFHKANGNPGPNFPLSGRESYGYDLQKMADDFLRFVPPHKITVIFGLFGYDWSTNTQNNNTTTAKAITTGQITTKFLNKCPYANCQIQRDSMSAETTIKYNDEEKTSHTIWFEDEQSIKQKEKVLKQKGINSFSYWAYTYF
jgi:spore germination protein YaaH